MSKIYQFTGELTAEKIEELHAQVQRDKAKPTPPWEGILRVAGEEPNMEVDGSRLSCDHHNGHWIGWRWGSYINDMSIYEARSMHKMLLCSLALLKLRETGGVVPETPDSWGDMHAPYVDNRGYVYGNSHTTSGLVDEFVARECAVIVHEYKEACK